MFSKIKPYMGNYVRYTYAALATMIIALIAYTVQFFMVYRIIRPLIVGETLSASYLAIHIAIIFVFELVYAYLYVLGLKFSHISAFNTLKNLRISLQKKLERQPLGTIHDMGNGRIKKLFTDDIEQVELLLAHAIPEGIAKAVQNIRNSGTAVKQGQTGLSEMRWEHDRHDKAYPRCFGKI